MGARRIDGMTVSQVRALHKLESAVDEGELVASAISWGPLAIPSSVLRHLEQQRYVKRISESDTPPVLFRITLGGLVKSRSIDRDAT